MDLLYIWVKVCDDYNICDGSNQRLYLEFYRLVEQVFFWFGFVFNSKQTVLLGGDTE